MSLPPSSSSIPSRKRKNVQSSGAAQSGGTAQSSSGSKPELEKSFSVEHGKVPKKSRTSPSSTASPSATKTETKIDDLVRTASSGVAEMSLFSAQSSSSADTKSSAVMSSGFDGALSDEKMERDREEVQVTVYYALDTLDPDVKLKKCLSNPVPLVSELRQLVANEVHDATGVSVAYNRQTPQMYWRVNPALPEDETKLSPVLNKEGVSKVDIDECVNLCRNPMIADAQNWVMFENILNKTVKIRRGRYCPLVLLCLYHPNNANGKVYYATFFCFAFFPI